MKTIFVEHSLASFEDFHDKDWFDGVHELAEGTGVEAIFEEFAAHWWGSSRAFVLPWLLVSGVHESLHKMVPLTQQDVWSEYLKQVEFQVALWKLAESMYCSIYYAYENLLVHILRMLKDSTIRVTDRNFTKLLIEVYGEKLANRIWNGNSISTFREIRNCIVHNGGKPSDALMRMRPLPHIKDGDIMISASDTRKLYKELKPIVYELVKVSTSKVRA
jgi:hypothetical protein